MSLKKPPQQETPRARVIDEEGNVDGPLPLSRQLQRHAVLLREEPEALVRGIVQSPEKHAQVPGPCEIQWPRRVCHVIELTALSRIQQPKRGANDIELEVPWLR